MLRGVGAAMALPVLDSMIPALTAAAEVTRKLSPSRMVFVYVPNGIDMRNWTPAAEGRSFALPKILGSLAPVQDDVLVLSGLTDHGGMALGDGPGDHARASASFLTGVHPKENRRLRHFGRYFSRSAGRPEDRLGHAARFSRTRLRGRPSGGQLRFRLQLRLCEQHFLAQRDVAQSAGGQSARGVRATLRQRR